MPYRDLSAQPDAQADFDQFIGELRIALTDGRRNPNEVVQETLSQI